METIGSFGEDLENIIIKMRLVLNNDNYDTRYLSLAVISSVSFCPVPTYEAQAEILVTSVTNVETPTLDESDKKEHGKRSMFEPRPKFEDLNLDCKKELD